MTDSEIVEKYSALVRVLALARTGQPSDADDVYQEVFIRYIDKQPAFRSEEHAKAWFIRVTINITKNMYKSAYNVKRADLDNEVLADMISDRDLMSEAEQRADFEQTLSRLNPRYKAVMLLHFDCGYTVREIAKLLGESEIAVKNCLVRGKQRYKEILSERNEVNESVE